MFQFLKGEQTNQSKTCVSGFYCYLQNSVVSACGVSAADMGKCVSPETSRELQDSSFWEKETKTCLHGGTSKENL